MATLESFAPVHLQEAAEASGFFQCRKCGLVWFGKPDADTCPQGPHGRPVHVVVLCRYCDAELPLESLARHLASDDHRMCVEIGG